MTEAFPGRAKKCAGTCFRRHQRGEHGPPRNAPTAKGEIFEVVFLSAHAQADEDDDEEIKEQNSGIDRESAIHVDLR